MDSLIILIYLVFLFGYINGWALYVSSKPTRKSFFIGGLLATFIYLLPTFWALWRVHVNGKWDQEMKNFSEGGWILFVLFYGLPFYFARRKAKSAIPRTITLEDGTSISLYE